MKKQTCIFAIVYLFSIQTKAQNIPPKSTIVVPPNAQQLHAPKKYTIIGAYETNSDITPKATITAQPIAKSIFYVTDVKISDTITSIDTTYAYYRNHRLRATITSTGVGIIKCIWVEKVWDGLGHLIADGPMFSEFSVKLKGTGIDFIDIIYSDDGYVYPNLKTFIIKSPIYLKSNEL